MFKSHLHPSPFDNCLNCGNTYKRVRYDQKFCSAKCRWKTRSKLQRLKNPTYYKEAYKQFLLRNPGYRSAKWKEWLSKPENYKKYLQYHKEYNRKLRLVP